MLGAKAHDIRSRRNRPRTGNSLEHERCGKGVQKSARRSERLIWCYLSLLTAGLRFLNACFHIWWRREVNKKSKPSFRSCVFRIMARHDVMLQLLLAVNVDERSKEPTPFPV